MEQVEDAKALGLELERTESLQQRKQTAIAKTRGVTGKV